MKSLLRSIAVSVAILGGMHGGGRASSVSAHASPDLAVWRQSSLALAHRTRDQVLRSIQANSAVLSSGLGPDGKTINIRFRDGFSVALLPAAKTTRTALSPRLPALELRTMSEQAGSGRRAAVLYPFSTELGLGPAGGAQDAQFLQEAGFQVDQRYDNQVPLSFMQNLSQYNVLDFNTHSGANTYGEGVLASATPFTDADKTDPALKPYLDEQSLLGVSVAGTDQLYLGITSVYIRKYLSPFPSNSLVILNGCDMLRANWVWDALHAKGVAAMVSWDQEVLPRDAQVAGELFLANMAQGMTVDQAFNKVKVAGYAYSTIDGKVAKLGYLGDGALKLDGTTGSPGPVTAPSPTPTIAPPPVATPTAASPLPTSTPFVGSLHLRPAVAPGSRQSISVAAPAGTSLHFTVNYPNGDAQRATRSAGPNGRATYTYTQRGSKIARGDLHARVIVSTDLTGSSAVAEGQYRIRFGPVDTWIPNRAVPSGQVLSIWVHSRHPATLVRTTIVVGTRRVGLAEKTTGPRGWFHIGIRIAAERGSSFPLRGTASATCVEAGRRYQARTTFVVTRPA